MLRKILYALLILVILSGAVFADTSSTNASAKDKDTVSSKGKWFSFSSTIGALTLPGEGGTNVTFTQMTFMFDFDFKNFGLGLYINLEFDEDGTFREGEWDSWQAIVSKIRFIRFGRESGSFFLKIGNLDNVTVGHGTIMERFSNNVFFPDIRMMGIQFNLDFKFVGIETFVENFLDYDIMVGRLYFRPLINTKIPILKRLEIGGTIAADLDNMHEFNSGKDKYEYDDNGSSTNVTVYGVDLGIPLPNLGILKWEWFADLVFIKDYGKGFTTGLMGKIVWLFNFKFEYNRFGKNFIAPFFDEMYMVDRAGKFSVLPVITEAYNGWKLTLWRNFSIVHKNDLTILLQYSDSDADGIKPQVTFQLHLDRKLLFNKLEFDFEYTKKNIDSFKDAFKVEGEDAVATAKLGYMVADNVMVSFYYMRYFVWDESTSQLVGRTTKGFETELKF